MSGDLIGRGVPAVELRAHAAQKRIDGTQKFLRRQAAQLRIPNPLMSHGAVAARRLVRIRDSAYRRREHVAMLEGSYETAALFRIVAQPVEELRESPFGGIRSSAPVNRFQPEAPRGLGDKSGLARGAVIAPKIVIV